MKSLVLDPRKLLYTEDINNPVTLEGALDILKELKKGEKIRTPIYVMRFPDFGDNPVIFNGNRRTKAAEWYGIPIKTLEIQNQSDFQLAQIDQPTYWHKVEEENFLRFNGEYFYKDINALKNRGLMIPAYHRAKKRIKEAIRRLYSWL